MILTNGKIAVEGSFTEGGFRVLERNTVRLETPKFVEAVEKAVALAHRPKKRSFTVEHVGAASTNLQGLVDYFDYVLDDDPTKDHPLLLQILAGFKSIDDE